MPLPGIIAEIFCNILFYGAIAAASDGTGKKTKIDTSSISIDSIKEKQRQGNSLSPSDRQALMSRTCLLPGCNIGNFRMTDYCHKHQDHKPIKKSKEETQPEENWWEDEN